MDCENSTSLSQTIEKIEETPKEMKAFTFKNTGEEGDINHVAEEAVIFIDSDVGKPDEGNSNEGDGEPQTDNIADEIGEPAKELVDVVAGEPTVGTDAEKDDEFGVSVGKPVEEDSRNSMQALEKDNSIEILKVTDNADHSVNGEEIVQANDKPVEEDSSNSMQEFKKETSTECLKFTDNADHSVNGDEILKANDKLVEEDSSISMQEYERETSTECLKITDNENCSVNEEKILKTCGEPVKEDNNQSTQEVEEDISNECLIATDNKCCSVNEEEIPKAFGEPVKEDSSNSMQEVKEENSTEPLKVIDLEECSVNDEEVPKANEGNIQCALADTDTISKINIKSEVPKSCISDAKALSNVKICVLKKGKKKILVSRRKTPFKSSSNEEKSKVEDVKSPEGHMLNIHGNDGNSDGSEIKGLGVLSEINNLTEQKSKSENTLAEYMPNIYGSDIGTERVEAKCLRTLSVKKKYSTFPFEERSKDENIKPLERYMPSKPGYDNGHDSDGGGAKCLSALEIILHAWSFPFGSLSKIQLLLLVKIWALVNSAAGAEPPLSSYQCCTYETSDSKVSFFKSCFSIKLGTEDICIYNPSTNYFFCAKGAYCFLLNMHIVKFCSKEYNSEAFIMELGKNKSTIHSSYPEELSFEKVAALREYVLYNSPTSTANMSPTTHYNSPTANPATRVHYCTIGAVAVVVILLFCVFFCCYKRHSDEQIQGDLRNEDMTAEKENELNANKEKLIV